MNVVFVNFGQSDNNSAYHIQGFARGLAARGHDVVVAAVKAAPDGEYPARDGHRLVSHRTALRLGVPFADGNGADILHVWTPREITRLFAHIYAEVWGPVALVVHQEDNEEAIFERYTGRTVEEAAREFDDDRDWSRGLIHPRRHREFVAAAQGVTAVHRCLEPLMAPGQRWIELPPAIDFEFFSPGPADPELREEWFPITIPRALATYNGNDHPAAMWDVRRLYEAFDLLLEDGLDIGLLRTGHTLRNAYDGVYCLSGDRYRELGFVDRDFLPKILRNIDFAIQPGDDDPFNACRLPAKVPEYLAMGVPLIAGRANIGRELEAADAAIVLDRTTPANLADAAEWLTEHPAEAAEMAGRARRFARRRFGAETILPALEAFYRECLEGGARFDPAR